MSREATLNYVTLTLTIFIHSVYFNALKMLLGYMGLFRWVFVGCLSVGVYLSSS